MAVTTDNGDMGNYSQAVVLGGDSPFDYADLRVFVAPAPTATERLFVRHARREPPPIRRPLVDACAAR